MYMRDASIARAAILTRPTTEAPFHLDDEQGIYRVEVLAIMGALADAAVGLLRRRGRG